MSFYCPQCGSSVAKRERRPNGNSICQNGHIFASIHERPACPHDNDGDGNCGNPDCRHCRTRPYLGFATQEPFAPAVQVTAICSSTLTFDVVQTAIRERGAAWGEVPFLYKSSELSGEVGELVEALLRLVAHTGKIGNVAKKLYRTETGMVGGLDPEEGLQAVREELGDAVICCFLVADRLGLNLGELAKEKFNLTSIKNGFPHRIVTE